MTQYAARPYDPTKDVVWQRILHQVHGICDCGHADFAHKLIWTDSINSSNDECEKCLCPKFKLEYNLTYREILSKKQKVGSVE